eukprot:Skav205220  [mRNA]  locus=scaffold400:235601:235945:- [translate_table: standard]
MWQSFAAGAAWALALARGSVEAPSCHCTCRCEVPEVKSSVGWEVVKALIWVGVGILLQLFKVGSFLLRRIWPVFFDGDHGVKEVGQPLQVEEVVAASDVEERAKQQILALRSRR